MWKTKEYYIHIKRDRFHGLRICNDCFAGCYEVVFCLLCNLEYTIITIKVINVIRKVSDSEVNNLYIKSPNVISVLNNCVENIYSK